MPDAALVYERRRKLEIRAAVNAEGRLWARMGPDIDASFDAIGTRLSAVALLAQSRVTDPVEAFVAGSLAQTGVSIDPDVAVSSRPLTGWAGDGRRVESLLVGARVAAKEALAAGAPMPAALATGGEWLRGTVATVLSDTSRAAVSLHTGARPGVGYVRVLEGASCARCAVLAGRFYKRRADFARHKRCDCGQRPATEETARDLVTDPKAYFDSLARADQDRLFTGAGAEAIRSGADVAKVVNARRGMYAAQSPGMALLATKSGATKIGEPVRLMPESIARMAGDDRSEYLRLLRLHGYLV